MSFNEWKEYNLDELCLEITDGSHSSPKTVEQGYSMASVKDMEYSKINLETCRKISKEDYEKLVKGKCKPEINDVLIAKDGSYLKYVNVVKEDIDLVLLSSIAILRPDIRKIDPDFFKYYLVNPIISQKLEQGYVSGSVIRRIVLKDFKKFKIRIPDIIVQKRIARILLDLDKKIEINNKINKKLEEMAQAIFKQWFVDFEFPNEDGKPYKSSGGEMVESELGMIPKGWETKKMEEVCVRINSGGTPSRKKEEYYGGDIPWLKTKELLDNFIFNSEEYITEKGLKESSAKVFPRNTVLMAIYASPTVGKLGIASSDVTFNQAMCGMVTNENMLCYEYLYLFLLKERINLNNLASGSAQQNLSVTTIKNYTILVPNIELIKQFKNVISNAFIKIENNSLENIRLSNIRDSILPKLMSGEIRVPMD